MGNELLEKIIAIRKRAGLSRRDLSLKIHRQDEYIARVEKGTYPLPPVEDLEKIASVCNSSMEELFYRNFESFNEDSKILDLLKSVATKSKHAIITLLVAQYEVENNSKK